MRSHPYKPPPPRPPLLDDLAACLPNSDRRRYGGGSEAPLPAMDHDTTPLMLRKPRQHLVWVQGRLVLVQSVSAAERKSGGHRPSPRAIHPHGLPLDPGAGGAVRWRRNAVEGSDADEAISEGDMQLRGYGIGGAGNIRRSITVTHPCLFSSPDMAVASVGD